MVCPTGQDLSVLVVVNPGSLYQNPLKRNEGETYVIFHICETWSLLARNTVLLKNPCFTRKMLSIMVFCINSTTKHFKTFRPYLTYSKHHNFLAVTLSILWLTEYQSEA